MWNENATCLFAELYCLYRLSLWAAARETERVIDNRFAMNARSVIRRQGTVALRNQHAELRAAQNDTVTASVQ